MKSHEHWTPGQLGNSAPADRTHKQKGSEKPRLCKTGRNLTELVNISSLHNRNGQGRPEGEAFKTERKPFPLQHFGPARKDQGRRKFFSKTQRLRNPFPTHFFLRKLLEVFKIKQIKKELAACSWLSHLRVGS